jgi:hypothetical protein
MHYFCARLDACARPRRPLHSLHWILNNLWHIATEAKALPLSGELRTFDYGRLWPATTRMTHKRHWPPNFAVTHNSAFARTVW